MKAGYTFCFSMMLLFLPACLVASDVIDNPNVLRLMEQAESAGPFDNVAAMHRLAILFKDGTANRKPGETPYHGVRRNDVQALYWLQRYDEEKAAQIKSVGKKKWEELCVVKRENRSTSGKCAHTDKRAYHLERHRGYLETLARSIRVTQSNIVLANDCQNGQCPEERYPGHHISIYETLAKAYVQGNGVEPNDAEAIRWFRAAAEIGGIEARYRLGEMYEKGIGMPADNALSLYWYQQAFAEMSKVPESWKKPTELYDLRRNDGKPRLEEAEEAVVRVGLKYEHEQGRVDPDTLYKRGLQFTYGVGYYVKDEGYGWIHAAAEAGHGQAMLHLHRLHAQSPDAHYPRYNRELAKQWLDRSMAVSNPDAFYVAYQLESRMSSPGARQRAFKLLEQAAELGHAEAMLMYFRYADRSSPEADLRAREYLQQSANMGNAEAQISQALLLKDTNRDEALSLLRLASTSPSYSVADRAKQEMEKIVDPVGYQRRVAEKEAADAAKQAAQAAANTPEALFIEHIHRYGPDTTDSGSFHYEVQLYCRYGGPNCQALQVRARQFQDQQNRAAERANMQRLWSVYGSGETMEEFGRRSRARSQCLQALTKSINDHTYGRQNWRYTGQCD